jgi:DNA-binding NarL/FixJ family response regulator
VAALAEGQLFGEGKIPSFFRICGDTLELKASFMETNSSQEIVKSLNRISKILAGLLLRDLEDAEQSKRIKRLKSCDFSNTEIAEMLHTTPNTVNVAVHALRAKRKKRSKKRR